MSGIPPTYAWTSGAFEQIALSLPTVSRARDLLASTISGLEFRQYVKQWNGTEYEEIYVPNESWMENPDPKVPRQFILANTVTDLWMTGRAFWAVNMNTVFVYFRCCIFLNDFRIRQFNRQS